MYKINVYELCKTVVFDIRELTLAASK